MDKTWHEEEKAYNWNQRLSSHSVSTARRERVNTKCSHNIKSPRLFSRDPSLLVRKLFLWVPWAAQMTSPAQDWEFKWRSLWKIFHSNQSKGRKSYYQRKVMVRWEGHWKRRGVDLVTTQYRNCMEISLWTSKSVQVLYTNETLKY